MMAAVSIRVYKEDRDRWRKLLSEKNVKAGELFAEMLEASRAMKVIQSILNMRGCFISTYGSKCNDRDMESVTNVCDLLVDWIISPESVFDNILDYSSDQTQKSISRGLELLDFEGNDFYGEFKKLMDKFKDWVKNVESALCEMDNIKSKLAKELPQSFLQDASFLECLDKYRKCVLCDDYMSTTGVLNYIEKE